MKAVICAAGHGTRMLPITKTIPKELLPVGNKPAIQHMVEGLVYSGIKDILIITSQSKKALEDYFDKNYELEEMLHRKGKHEALEEINKPKFLANFAFVKQHQQLGTGHAVLQAAPRINDEFFLVSFADMIFHEKVFQEMVALHQSTNKSVIMLQEVPREDVSKYGVVSISDGKIIDMVEKPTRELAPSNLVGMGIYILPKKIFEIIRQTPMDAKSGEVFLPDAIKLLMKTDDVLPYISKHQSRDVGNPEGWLQANIDFANKAS